MNIIKGAVYAVRTGVSLNRFISINWSTARVSNSRQATRIFLKRTGDWLRQRGVKLSYIWIREGAGGDHIHILLHVPSHLVGAFWREQRRWLRALGAGKTSRSVKTEAIGRSYSDYETIPAAYLCNLRGVIRYLFKLGQDAGYVRGLRASVSESLNHHARLGFMSGRRRKR